MSLHDAIKAKLEEAEGPKLCKFGSLVMPKDDADAVRFAVEKVREGKLPIAWLVQVLNDNGYSIGKTVVSDHVRGTCACDHRQ